MEKHLNGSQLTKLAIAKTKYNAAYNKILNKVNRKAEDFANRFPELSESEIDQYRDKMLNEVDLPKLTAVAFELAVHCDDCFICRNKLNKMMGIEEELILREDV